MHGRSCSATVLQCHRAALEERALAVFALEVAGHFGDYFQREPV
jgi:hypothetical protein